MTDKVADYAPLYQSAKQAKQYAITCDSSDGDVWRTTSRAIGSSPSACLVGHHAPARCVARRSIACRQDLFGLIGLPEPLHEALEDDDSRV